MAHPYTIDASVFLNAFNPFEQGHEESRALLTRARAEAVPMVEPSLLLPEAAAAVACGRDDAELARRFATQLHRLPHLVWVPLDEGLAGQAADIAAQHLLRGADAVYAAVAFRFGATLVTLDFEMHSRVGSLLPTRFPAEALTEWHGPA
jgi:predicted nucleic acid-binding protein